MDRAAALHERGRLHRLEGRLDAAEADLRASLRLSGGTHPVTRHALGVVLLAQGRWTEGWPLYEARHEVPSLRNGKPDVPYPEWRGQSLAGKRLLVIREQGFGDQIMYVRFALQARDAGAQVILLTAPALVPLFATLEGLQVLPAQGPTELPDADLWVMWSSLAARFDATPQTISGAPYLQVPGAPSGTGRVGVVTRGNPRHPNDADRSLPDQAAAALLATPGAVSLMPEDTGFTDFLQTAQAIAALDRVITVDTAVAHLAGALGKPVEIRLAPRGVDWRWLTGRSDTPWYDSATLVRADAPAPPTLTRN